MFNPLLIAMPSLPLLVTCECRAHFKYLVNFVDNNMFLLKQVGDHDFEIKDKPSIKIPCLSLNINNTFYFVLNTKSLELSG